MTYSAIVQIKIFISFTNPPDGSCDCRLMNADSNYFNINFICIENLDAYVDITSVQISAIPSAHFSLIEDFYKPGPP